MGDVVIDVGLVSQDPNDPTGEALVGLAADTVVNLSVKVSNLSNSLNNLSGDVTGTRKTVQGLTNVVIDVRKDLKYTADSYTLPSDQDEKNDYTLIIAIAALAVGACSLVMGVVNICMMNKQITTPVE